MFISAVIEHGANDLRGLGYDGRLKALIARAAPIYWEAVAADWRDAAKIV
jgi:acyl-CoA hydrolase